MNDTAQRLAIAAALDYEELAAGMLPILRGIDPISELPQLNSSENDSFPTVLQRLRRPAARRVEA